MKFLKYIVPVLALAIFLLTGLFGGGCTKRLEGQVADNIAPTVWFVNVPPEGDLSSVNPIINWVGQDRDGLIDFYRYVVVNQIDIVDALGLPSGTSPT